MIFKPRPLPLRYFGDDALRVKAARVGEVTDDVRALARRMIATMEAELGIGLAAPQVGHSLRLIVLDVPTPERGLPPAAAPGDILLLPRMPLALANPETLSAGPLCWSYDEGCLSVPEVHAEVIRPERIVLRATTLDGDLLQIECGGLLARCLQHEIDHLDGVLFVDRLAPDSAARVAAELAALAERTARERKHREPRGVRV